MHQALFPCPHKSLGTRLQNGRSNILTTGKGVTTAYIYMYDSNHPFFKAASPSDALLSFGGLLSVVQSHFTATASLNDSTLLIALFALHLVGGRCATFGGNPRSNVHSRCEKPPRKLVSKSYENSSRWPTDG